MSLSVKIILVRPRNPQNIGAAARVMANFGFSELAVVAPHPPVWEEVRSAVGGEELLAAAVLHDSLEAAVADCALVLGTTCANNRRVGQKFVLLPEIAEYLRERTDGGSLRIAVVFGQEKTGLTGIQLSMCHALLNVPTSKKTPSMNLAQSVAVCCYELSKLNDFEKSPVPCVKKPTHEDALLLCRELDAVLTLVGFNKRNVYESLRLERLRRLVLSCAQSADDFSYLRAIVKQLASTYERKNP
jgi:tRNA/rRNA methyltransferase